MADQRSRAGRALHDAARSSTTSNACTRATTPALARAFTVPEGIPAIQVGPSEGKLLSSCCCGSRARRRSSRSARWSATRRSTSRARSPPAATCGRSSSSRGTPRSRARTSPPRGSPIASTVHVGAGRDVLPTLVDARAVRRRVHRRRQGELRPLRPLGARPPAPGRPRDRRQRVPVRRAPRGQRSRPRDARRSTSWSRRRATRCASRRPMGSSSASSGSPSRRSVR